MRWGIVLAVGLASSVARADDHPDLLYVEAFGKGGAYGVGYERTLAPWLAVGAAASFVVIRDQQIATGAPYAHATIAHRGHHALFGELGAVIVHSRIPSPVPEWDGMTDTGAGGTFSLGWERATRHLVLRAQAAVMVGAGGLAPWGGFAIGVRP